MKKNLYFLITATFLFAVACSPRKNTATNRTMQGFTTYYNTLFNGKDALQTEIKNRDFGHKDNFYAPYIQLLTYEDQPLGSDVASSPAFVDNLSQSPMQNQAIGRYGNVANQQNYGLSGQNNQNNGASLQGKDGNASQTSNRKGATVLQIAEAKALKAIAKHSMNFGGEEKNKTIFDAYVLLAQSRIYQDRPLEALDALNYLFTNMAGDKRLPLAKIYQALAFTKMKDYYRANEAFASLNDNDLKKEYEKLKTLYYSEMLLDSGKKEDAIAELDKAFEVNKNRKIRSRIAFLRGQILANLGKKEEARESFVTAYKYANDFEFEVKSQIEIAKTYNGNADDYDGAKNYLEGISKKGTYASRKNEFYYALGLMADKAGKKDQAMDFYQKSLRMKVSDPQIRGLTFYEIGRAYFAKEDYLGAGAYYDSALAVMTYAPSKEALTELSANIKKVSKNYYLVKKNDSILALTKMTEPERSAYFAKYIETIKAKEAKDELARKNSGADSRGFGVDVGSNAAFANNNLNSFQDFSGSAKGFYFDNSNTVAKGETDFKRIWGDRQLADNWRNAPRAGNLEDLKNDAMGKAPAKNPRRLEPSYYTEQIPTDPKNIAELKKARDTASLGLGRMYDNYFSNTKLATKTLYDLVDAKPEDEVRLQALYSIFSMNYKDNPAAAERANNIILADYPYTSYAEFVKNPRSTGFSKSTTEVQKLYENAYVLYKQEKYAESQATANAAIEKFPKDALVPKFTLLNAFNAGKTAGKEVMILQLQQILLNYPKTQEGERAAEILKYLKTDLAQSSTPKALDKPGAATPAPEQKQPPVMAPEEPETFQRNYRGTVSPQGAPQNSGIKKVEDR